MSGQRTFSEHAASNNLRNIQAFMLVAVLISFGNVTHDHALPDGLAAYMWVFRFGQLSLALTIVTLAFFFRKFALSIVYYICLSGFLYQSAWMAGISINMGGLAGPVFINNAFLIALSPVFFLFPRLRFLGAQVAATGPFIALLIAAQDADLWVHSVNLIPAAGFLFWGQSNRYAVARREYEAKQEIEQTKEKLSEALDELNALSAARDRFFNNVTHELRTPLTMILAPIEAVLEEDIGVPIAIKRDLRGMRRNALVLLRLINDLLDLSKAGEGFLKLAYQPVNMSELVAHLVREVEPLAQRKNIQIELEDTLSDPTVLCDPTKVERVLINLLSNALKFTPEQGKVSVCLEAAGEGRAQFYVKDTGIGIPKDKHGTIFERFSQADGSTTRKYGGTGIGLAFAKELVELHEGNIRVESEPGQGSTFFVELPVQPSDESLANQASQTTEESTSEWTKKQTESAEYRLLDIEVATERRRAKRTQNRIKQAKVLVIEDSQEILTFVHSQLDADYDVYMAEDGEKGVQIAKQKAPDLIITDFMMPKLDGMGVIKALREEELTRQTPIIMLTAKDMLETRIEAGEKGADVYLAKPFSVKELRVHIARLLQARGLQIKTVIDTQSHSLEVISAGLAHEINNPLNFIRNANALIQASVDRLVKHIESGDPEAIEKALKKEQTAMQKMKPVAARGIQRIQDIVELVQRFAREGYAKGQETIVVDKLIADVLDIVQNIGHSETKGTKIITELDTEGMTIQGITFELQQAIRNIVQNALDALQGTGTIKIGSQYTEGELQIDIQDDGPGMSEEVKARAFAPFFSTKDPGQGMGLGLSLTKQIIEGHGGVLELHSQVGQGTQFKVRLPVRNQQDTELLEAA